MKHRFGKFLRLCCLGGLIGITLPAIHAEENANYLKNPSFEVIGETGLPEGWNAPEAFTADKTVARTGNVSFKWANENKESYPLSSYPLALEPGKAYHISMWIKTDKVQPKKVLFCVEWDGPNGKWMGGNYAHGIGGTKDWTKVECRVNPPENAQNIRLSCFGARGTTGTAWFDDVEITRYHPPLFNAITTDHYRHQTVGDTVQVFLGIDTASYPPGTFQKPITLEVTGETLEKPIVLQPTSEEEDFLVFTLETKDLPCGKYRLTGHGKLLETGAPATASLTLTRLEQFPERKAYIDEHRRLILDGKPFFPLGLYFGGVTPEDAERLGKSSFNCIMPYRPISREMLDLLYTHGIRTIYSVKDYYEGLAAKTAEEGREKTTSRIESLKDHPGIMAWYINDELPLHMLEMLSGRRDLVESLDPGRPTWVVLYQVDDIRSYIPSFDVIGTDPYPVPIKPISMAWEWSRKTNRAVFYRHATWQVPQLFNKANYQKVGLQRFRTPTYDETRAMIWMNIAGGANGIVCYSYFDLFQDDALPEDDTATKKAKFEKRWADIARIADEVAAHVPTLLSVEKPMEVANVDGDASPVAWRCYGKDGKTHLLVVNTTPEPQKGTFALPKEAVLAPDSADPNTLEPGRLTLELAPLECRWVILETSK
ncbi:MAG: carbohydrate binding domain-containing protein [Planctomycetia bacterium]|nr:carbohydrate binding domain-containing protein [Planctomycetia bacterium]